MTFLSLLGAVKLDVRGATAELRSQQLRAALSVLGLSPEGVSREQLSSLLWPDVERRTRLHSLSQLLYRLKTILPPEDIAADSERVRLEGVDVDYARFWASVDRSPFEAADLIRGGLVENLAWTSAALEAWIDPFRVRLGRRMAVIAEALRQSGQWERLYRVTAAILATDVTHSARARELQDLASRGLASEGQEAEEHASLVEPSRGFVGRVNELASLTRKWEDSDSESSHVVVVTGEPGVGKTTLCNRFLRSAAILGARTLLATGYQSEQLLAFGVVGQLLRDPTAREVLDRMSQPWSQIIGESFPGLIRDSNGQRESRIHGQGEFALFEALRQLIKSIGRVVVFVDDAMWCDAASLSWLHYLSRLSPNKDLFILLAARESYRSSVQAAFQGASELCLSELGPEDVKQLIRIVDPESVKVIDPDSLFAHTGGNPLLIRLLLEQPDGAVSKSQDDRVAELLRPRLLSLSSEAQVVLASLVVVGDNGDLALLSEVSALSEGVLQSVVVDLVKVGFLVERDGGLAATHGLAGEVLLREMPDVTKRALYARAAAALRRGRSAPSAVLAVKYDLAGEPTNAFRYATEAAEASLRLYAHREAEFFLKLALAYAPNIQATANVLLNLSGLLLKLGRPQEARQALDSFDISGVEDEESVLAIEAHLLLAAIPGNDHLDQALADARRLLNRAMEIQHYAIAGLLLTHLTRYAHDFGYQSAAIEFCSDLLTLANCTPDASSAQSHRVLAAGILGLTKSTSVGLSIIGETAPSSAAPAQRVRFLYIRATLLVASGRLDEAECHFLEAIAIAEKYGLVDILFSTYNNLGVCYLEAGRLDEAEAAYERSTYFVAPAGWEGLVRIDNLSVVSYERGEFAETQELARESLRRNVQKASSRSWYTALALLGLASLQLGELREANECERELRLALRHGEYWLTDIAYIESFFARMQVHRGKVAEALSGLLSASKRYADRDFFCRNRMRVEMHRIARLHRSHASLCNPVRLFRRLRAGSANLLAGQLARYCPAISGEADF